MTEVHFFYGALSSLRRLHFFFALSVTSMASIDIGVIFVMGRLSRSSVYISKVSMVTMTNLSRHLYQSVCQPRLSTHRCSLSDALITKRRDVKAEMMFLSYKAKLIVIYASPR
ncbi:hypothetical protein BCR43DRAFT_292346 [Syncephalastrum racemosum]|uniref:Uncharacterized protein n=1 Tax=Syncephalastrum racemosum TaxID=13706 RepID=A0A1X2HDN7_SYNRA|nr:hypothetical protein BCR43DRAFT_292346 [Syncephalastrum racemosum]